MNQIEHPVKTQKAYIDRKNKKEEYGLDSTEFKLATVTYYNCIIVDIKSSITKEERKDKPSIIRLKCLRKNIKYLRNSIDKLEQEPVSNSGQVFFLFLPMFGDLDFYIKIYIVFFRTKNKRLIIMATLKMKESPMLLICNIWKDLGIQINVSEETIAARKEYESWDNYVEYLKEGKTTSFQLEYEKKLIKLYNVSIIYNSLLALDLTRAKKGLDANKDCAEIDILEDKRLNCIETKESLKEEIKKLEKAINIKEADEEKMALDTNSDLEITDVSINDLIAQEEMAQSLLEMDFFKDFF